MGSKTMRTNSDATSGVLNTHLAIANKVLPKRVGDEIAVMGTIAYFKSDRLCPGIGSF